MTNLAEKIEINANNRDLYGRKMTDEIIAKQLPSLNPYDSSIPLEKRFMIENDFRTAHRLFSAVIGNPVNLMHCTLTYYGQFSREVVTEPYKKLLQEAERLLLETFPQYSH